MKNIVIYIIIIIAMISACAAVIPASNEISMITYNAAGVEIETVITWKLTNDVTAVDDTGVITVERFISVERYISGDINDCIYFGIQNKHYQQPATGENYDWHKLIIEAWHDVDAAWIDLQIGF